MNVAISCMNIELDILGGVQNRLRHLIMGLIDEGMTVHIIQTKSAFKRSQDFYNSLDHNNNLRNIIIPDTQSTKIPWLYIKQHSVHIQKRLSENDIDIFDTYDPYTSLSSDEIPVIYTTNFFIDYVKELFALGEIRYAYMHLLKCLIEGRIINVADHFIIQNSIQKKRLIDHYGIKEESISIIPTGYDSMTVDNVKGMPISDNPGKIIMFSGRLSKYKGVQELIEAFNEIAPSNPKWDMWLVGDGPLRRSLETFAKDNGLSNRVKFLGFQSPSETIKYVNMCDIFAFPSYIESIPGSLLEAMALGKPVVTTDIGAIGADIIKNNNGILVPPKNSKALEEGILKLIKDEQLRKSMGANGEAKVKDITKKKMVEKTIKAYDLLVKK